MKEAPPNRLPTNSRLRREFQFPRLAKLSFRNLPYGSPPTRFRLAPGIGTWRGAFLVFGGPVAIRFRLVYRGNEKEDPFRLVRRHTKGETKRKTRRRTQEKNQPSGSGSHLDASERASDLSQPQPGFGSTCITTSCWRTLLQPNDFWLV